MAGSGLLGGMPVKQVVEPAKSRTFGLLPVLGLGDGVVLAGRLTSDWLRLP